LDQCGNGPRYDRKTPQTLQETRGIVFSDLRKREIDEIKNLLVEKVVMKEGAKRGRKNSTSHLFPDYLVCSPHPTSFREASRRKGEMDNFLIFFLKKYETREKNSSECCGDGNISNSEIYF
jgi:hypothetical protein